jgi:tetratricopeptide (TPR) repeat protein
MANPWGDRSNFGVDENSYHDPRLRYCADHDLPYERALEFCRQAIEGASLPLDAAAALIERGRRYEHEGANDLAAADYQRALASYQEQITRSESIATAHAGRGVAYNHLRQGTDAEAAFTQAIGVDPNLAEAYYNRGVTRFRLGNFTQAIDDFDEAARLAVARNRRGSMFRVPAGARIDPIIHAKRCEARAAARIELNVAQAACRDAIRTSDGDHRFSRGFLSFMQGDIDAARADFLAAAEANENSGFALYGRGVTSILIGQQAEGEADIARALDLSGAYRLAGYATAGMRAPAASSETVPPN